jgi:hypothetical protein
MKRKSKLQFSRTILYILLENRNTCMQRPLAYIVQTLFQHKVFVIITERTLALHAMLVMATR